ncbi:FMN-binding protein MioC [Paraferrimonas sp. SM1919]|uniref:FMN-binding protein MioC n=1 Tax=Paraferrimonas sp. SM1919 TaxID=2662263 RepID=UPI0013D68AEC|nr:FMN-binding protein MioC [Paraferrimonas sp. SM1919]
MVEIIIGSTLGNAEFIAEELAALLEENQIPNRLHFDPNLDNLNKQCQWLLVCSTHGAGELPENIRPFYQQLQCLEDKLSDVKFAICAIGDKNYDTFCEAGKTLEDQLIQACAKPIVNKIELDMSADLIVEDQALQWLGNHIDSFKS